MDEISKLVFGCVALVGLVVMIIPNSDPLAADKASIAAPGAAIPPPPQIANPPAEGTPAPATGESSSSSGGFAVQDYNIGSFGEPMVDPTPPGQRNNTLPQNNGYPPPPNIGQQYETPPPQGQGGIPPGAPGVPIAPPPVVQPN